MNKKLNHQNSSQGFLAIPLLVLIVAVVLLGGLYFTNNLQKVGDIIKGPFTSKQKANIPDQAKVIITEEGFMPETITIKKGTQLTWVNKDDNAPHQIASDPHPTHTNLIGFDSQEPIKYKESFTYTFEKTGTFTYHDHLNPFKFKGTVIVE